MNTKLGKPTDQKLALVSNLATDLLWYGRIETTLEKVMLANIEQYLEDAKNNLLANWKDGANREAVIRMFNEFRSNYSFVETFM